MRPQDKVQVWIHLSIIGDGSRLLTMNKVVLSRLFVIAVLLIVFGVPFYYQKINKTNINTSTLVAGIQTSINDGINSSHQTSKSASNTLLVGESLGNTLVGLNVAKPK